MPIRITNDDTRAASDDRFHRFRLMGWWDQACLTGAKVLVVGAGALGNEIVKNLAMLGVGNLLIADMDRVENSNLSRSILFRERDNGRYKAEAAAAMARDIYPDIRVQHFNGDILYDLGAGAYRWADVVIGGLDNREARLAINRHCQRVKKTWIDGAIEQIQGCARVFAPDGPCYECTMSEIDWKILNQRRSCNLLTRDQMLAGRTPTTPTISSIIAGVQCQEAVKLLHGMETISGKGWVFEGFLTDSYLVEYQRKDECYSHDPLDEIIALDQGAAEISPHQLLTLAAEKFGHTVELELCRETVCGLACGPCGTVETTFTSPQTIAAEHIKCSACRANREVRTFHKINGDEPFIDTPLSECGVPPFDIIIARGLNQSIGFELSGDASDVLGELTDDEEGLEFE